jgi:hypothetical protein
LPAPLEKLQAAPRPSLVVGFPTQVEQLEAQQYILTCSPVAMMDRIWQWQLREDIKLIEVRKANPGEHTYYGTEG